MNTFSHNKYANSDDNILSFNFKKIIPETH